MSYIVLSCIVLVLSYGYGWVKQNKSEEKTLQRLLLGIIIVALCLFAGLRTRYNDTYAYLQGFQNMPDDFSALFGEEFSFSEVYLFSAWGYFIHHYISANVNVYFFLSSIIFVVPSVLLIEKYSKNFLLSMLMYMFAGMYLFSLAGLKQSMATGIILMGLPALFKKQYIRYYLCCIIALGFHMYSIFFLLLPLLGRDKIFNKATILTCAIIFILGVGMSFFSSIISSLIEFLGKDVDEETLESGSVNILRALVYIVPLLLTVFSSKRLDAETSTEEKIFLKTAILSSMFMVLALFGNPILFGRIPQYFYVGLITMLPLILQKSFVKNEWTMIQILAGILYGIFGFYSLYKDGAFSIDIFRLTWFW